jgi:SAM-dependent methyltransferase
MNTLNMREYWLTPITARCPVCFSQIGHTLYSVDTKQAAQHFVLKEVNPKRHDALRSLIESLWDSPTCDVVRCIGCTFCFAYPFRAGDEGFYNLAYAHHSGSYPSSRYEFERTLESLRSLNLGDFHLFEVGAGDGAFIKRVAPELTQKENVLTTEYSDYGREAIESYGIACLQQDIRSLPDEHVGRFSVVCMFQVLEHLDELEQLFVSLGRLFKESSHLFISVPNGKRIEFNELNGALLDMPPNHVGRWNRKSFEVIAKRHGWHVLEHEIEEQGLKSRAIDYLTSRYRRKRQEKHTLANTVERLPTSPTVKRGLQAATCGLYALAPASLRKLYALLKTRDLGQTQWIHLHK